jgi:purine nucleosidase
MKLIIDCDCGIDDAYGIMLASVTQNVEILAINVVHGNSTLDNCAVNTKLVVDKIFDGKQQPPIYLGATQPLVKFQTGHEESYHGFDGLAGVRNLYFQKEVAFIHDNWSRQNQSHASLKLIELVEKYPNEITVVALGPLTNLALAVKMHNEPKKFTQSIKNLIIMGGNELSMAKPENVEFNFAKDPIAAKIVIEDFECSKTICTFQMTLKCFYGVDLEQVYGLVSKYSAKSEKCKFMQTIAFHRQSDGKFKDYISCDFIAMIVALCGNQTAAISSSEHCCIVDIEQNKGLILNQTDGIQIGKKPMRFIESLPSELVVNSLVGCFERLYQEL